MALPGVVRVDRRGEAVVLSCCDSDAAIRALLDAHPEARDVEIASAGLEEAFLELTKPQAEPADNVWAIALALAARAAYRRDTERV